MTGALFSGNFAVLYSYTCFEGEIEDSLAVRGGLFVV